MEEVQRSIVLLNGTINAQIEQMKKMESRINSLETVNMARKEISNSSSFVNPQNEAELEAIRKLPDSVRDLVVFDGNPAQYVSWIHSVESILKDYEVVRNKPIYSAILKHVRQKIRGLADSALISYNIFNEEWHVIKQCLSLHYADKRDIQSLENQLVIMRQGRDTVDRFYEKVNHQLSLIINKIQTNYYTEDGANCLIENYRLRTLDVFVRGLNGNLPQLIKVQKPKNLPEAYTACLEMQNMNYRTSINHQTNNIQDHSLNFPRYNNYIPPHKHQQSPNYQKQQNYQQQPVKFYQDNPYKQFDINPIPPPRPTQPKPPTPMEINESIKSAKINYINKPRPIVRQSNESSNIPRKHQRMFNIETEQYSDEEKEQVVNFYEGEVNFMEGASPAPPI